MLISAIQTLFAYNTWANQRVFDEVLHLTPDQFISIEHGDLSSIYDTLCHIVHAQHLWLTRCQETAPPAEVTTRWGTDCQTLRRTWEKVDQETHAFLGTLDAPALQRIIQYVNPQEEANAYPLWQLLYHQLNHAAQHRSEVAVSLTHFGYSPGWLDFLYYLDLRDGTV